MNISFNAALVAAFFLCGPFAEALPMCTSLSREGNKCIVLLSQLHPTQTSVGLRDVEIKEAKMRAMKNKELKEYLKNKPLDVVIGPGGVVYAIDGHHFALGAMYANIPQTFGKVIHNFSKLNEEKFWQTMAAKGLVYLFVNGDGPIDPRQIPRYIDQMRNDVYRSLASAARDRGAFKKSNRRFFEYIWTEFFRLHIRIGPGERGYQIALDEAVKLAQSDFALGLPGHIRNKNDCGEMLRGNRPLRRVMKKYLN